MAQKTKGFNNKVFLYSRKVFLYSKKCCMGLGDGQYFILELVELFYILVNKGLLGIGSRSSNTGFVPNFGSFRIAAWLCI